VFHNLITLPTFHMTARFMNDLSKGCFGEENCWHIFEVSSAKKFAMACAVKHQHEFGSDLGYTLKDMTGGERALKASRAHNTISQFENTA